MFSYVVRGVDVYSAINKLLDFVRNSLIKRIIKEGPIKKYFRVIR